jgi:hypothetical protein
LWKRGGCGEWRVFWGENGEVEMGAGGADI